MYPVMGELNVHLRAVLSMQGEGQHSLEEEDSLCETRDFRKAQSISIASPLSVHARVFQTDFILFSLVLMHKHLVQLSYRAFFAEVIYVEE